MSSPHLVTPLTAAALCGAIVASAATTVAAPAEKRPFDLPRGDATVTLKQFSATAGTPIVYLVDRVRGATTNAVAGEFTPRDALERMLAGSALEAAQDNATGALVVSRRPASDAPAQKKKASLIVDPSPSPRPQPTVSHPRRSLVTALALFLGSAVAQADTGSIAGRVLDATTGQYVANAQIEARPAAGPTPSGSLDGARPPSTATDNLGAFRLSAVPAGDVIVRATYLGLPPVEKSVRVTAGQASTVELALGGDGAATPVVLDAFTVNVSRQLSATALAVNGQRYAGNTRSVVAVDELGFTGDGSVAGAMKFLPGVDLEPDATGFSNGITLSGAPSANVPVTYGGFDVMTSADLIQNASGNQNQRTANLMQLSLANISRIEINRSPTPDTPGSALAGSVNFVPKSAFERVRPAGEIQAFASANRDALTFRRTSGPHSDRQRQLYPGLQLSAVVPLSRSFGFSLTLGHNESPKAFGRTLREKTANWDLATQNFKPTPNNPEHYMLYWHEVNNILSTYTRDSVNLTLDYKLSPDDTLSASFTQSYNELISGQRQIRWTIDRQATSLDLVNSTARASQTVAVPAVNSTVLNNTYYTDLVDRNRQFQLKYRHRGRVWRGEAGASYGTAGRTSHDLDRGFIFSSLYNLTRTSIRLADIQPWTVGSITAIRNGVAVNPMDLNTFVSGGNFTSTVAGTSPAATITSSLPPVRIKPYSTSDRKSQASASLARSFDLPTPLELKLGFDISDYERSQRYNPSLGTNGSGFAYNGTDVSLTQFLNPTYDGEVPGGLGVPTSIDNAKLARFFQDNRAKFVQLNPGNDYQTAVSNSKFLHETIAAGYLRFDQRLLRNRLWLVYGLRYERTTDEGEGPRNDPTGNYRRNAAGQFINAAGNPVPVGTTPALVNTAGSLSAIQATWFERGARAKRSYGSYFPSLNANFNVTDRLVARVSYSETIGRPDIYNVAPGLTLPDPTVSAPRITVTNPGIDPWQSRNVSASLEFYSDKLGDVTLRGYRRFVRNAFATQLLPAAQAREVIDLYGIDLADYPGNTTISTLRTVPGTVVTSGLELSGRYQLDEFLPAWARGFQFKFSAARSTLTGGGPAATAFAAQNLYLVPWSAGGGLSFVRPRFSVSLNGKWNDTQRLAYIDPNTDANGPIEPGTYEYLDAAFRLDLDATLRLTPKLSLFINGRDINGYSRTLLRYGPNTPDFLKGRQRDVYQPVWTLGMTAKF
jgi:iron complex outermembrane recepter protein